MAFIKEFLIKATVLFLLLIVGFTIVRPFISCGDLNEYQCMMSKLTASMPHTR